MDVLELLDEIRAIAQTGLHFAENPFDRDRYARLLELAAQHYGGVLAIEPAEVRARFQREIGQATTKVGADGVVFDDDGRVLLVKRADDGRWGLVAGWVEPGEHPRDTIAREFAEELGVEGRARELVDVFARPASAEYGPHGIIAVVYLCDVASRDFRMQPHEVVDAGWHHLDDVDAWHMNHETYARAAYDAWRRRDGR